ncbi:hypothetical protein HWA77_24080, partial [Photobacterium damselae subsp. damselae]|nr:hypothetical protein [Photobacterium damselae subsp. damselae]
MNKNKLKLLFVLISLGTPFVKAAVVNDVIPRPRDESSADVQWIGHAKIIPGDNMTITGEYGAS